MYFLTIELRSLWVLKNWFKTLYQTPWKLKALASFLQILRRMECEEGRALFSWPFICPHQMYDLFLPSCTWGVWIILHCCRPKMIQPSFFKLHTKGHWPRVFTFLFLLQRCLLTSSFNLASGWCVSPQPHFHPEKFARCISLKKYALL